MNIMLIRSPMPALRVAPPALGQHRVCHRWMRSERARSTSRTTCTYAEDFTSCCLGSSLNTGIGMRVRRDRPKSP
jgi:hypothetical protein